MYSNLTLKDFIEELSSKSPAPGGGSAAALCAALASSLTAMVYNLTIGKKSYEQLEDSVKQSIQKGLECENENKIEFLSSIDQDADAFLRLMSSFKLPKSSEEEIKYRQEEIENRTRGAIKVPYDLAEKSFSVYDNVLIAARYGNINAVSDAGVAALMLQAAIEGAVLNVKINLSSIKDEIYKRDMLDKCNYFLSEGSKKRDEILKEVNNKIK
jgi:methenyltetrahydrofolate cyclohydrolase